VKIAVNERNKQFSKALKANNVSNECHDGIFTTIDSYGDNISSTFDLFRTPFRIKRYMEDNFSLVLPSKIRLGKGEFQYVPLVKLLKKIVADKTFQKHRRYRTRNLRDNILEDIEDGQHFKNNGFFLKNPDAMKLVIVSVRILGKFAIGTNTPLTHFCVLLRDQERKYPTIYFFPSARTVLILRLSMLRVGGGGGGSECSPTYN
jgi:hypothetical protein